MVTQFNNQSTCYMHKLLFASIFTLITNLGFAAPGIIIDKKIMEMSLEDLMNMTISTVSRKPQNTSDTAAAVFVISQEDIRRSSANSIPELLRMAPGLSVARIDANKWSVTSRGFSGRFADDLLVMVDGRAIFPLYLPEPFGNRWIFRSKISNELKLYVAQAARSGAPTPPMARYISLPKNRVIRRALWFQVAAAAKNGDL